MCWIYIYSYNINYWWNHHHQLKIQLSGMTKWLIIFFHEYFQDERQAVKAGQKQRLFEKIESPAVNSFFLMSEKNQFIHIWNSDLMIGWGDILSTCSFHLLHAMTSWGLWLLFVPLVVTLSVILLHWASFCSVRSGAFPPAKAKLHLKQSMLLREASQPDPSPSLIWRLRVNTTVPLATPRASLHYK